MTIIKKVFNRTKRRKIILSVVFIVICFTLYQNDLPGKFCWRDSVNISCYYSQVDDALATIESYSPLSRSIFFHETSCFGNLTSRQSCAIESAARTHSNWQIYVLFSGPIPLTMLNTKSFMIFKAYQNVNFARVNIKEYSKGTPLQDLIESDVVKKSKWKIEHTSDLLKYLTLYKWGGISMDLDLIVAKPLGSLARNWAARDSDSSISSGILAFSKDSVGQKFAEVAIRDLNQNYKDRDLYSKQSGVITRVLQSLCSTRKPSSMSAATCDGFEIYGQQFFYPIGPKQAHDYFRPGELRVHNVYTYHLWGHITKEMKVMRGSPYARLAKRYCPSTYNLYGNKFGIL